MERLVDALWPDEPPDNAVQALYNQVSRLRGQPRPPRIPRLEKQGAGYRLHLEPDELDVDVVRRLSPARARADLAQDALDLWRGPALEEFRALPALDAEAVGLDELRQQLRDVVLEARIAAGDRSATADAASAASAAPLRERSTILLMRALAADGRAAEAMAVGAAFRRLLAEETGLDSRAGPGRARAGDRRRVFWRGAARHSWSPRAVLRPDGPLVGRGRDREEVLRLLASNSAVNTDRAWRRGEDPAGPRRRGRDRRPRGSGRGQPGRRRQARSRVPVKRSRRRSASGRPVT